MQPLALATPQLPYFSTVKPSFPPGLFPILSHSVTPVSPPKVSSNLSSSSFLVPSRCLISTFAFFFETNPPIRQSPSLSLGSSGNSSKVPHKPVQAYLSHTA